MVSCSEFTTKRFTGILTSSISNTASVWPITSNGFPKALNFCVGASLTFNPNFWAPFSPVMETAAPESGITFVLCPLMRTHTNKAVVLATLFTLLPGSRFSIVWIAVNNSVQYCGFARSSPTVTLAWAFQMSGTMS